MYCWYFVFCSMNNCREKTNICSNFEADQHLCFCCTNSMIPLDFPPLAVFCACTDRVVSDPFGNHIVGFLIRRLSYFP